MKTFQDFWPYYLGEHRRPATRALHFIGSTAGLMCWVSAPVSGEWLGLPVGFAIGYAMAWIGHFGFERNRPATFKHPLWSFLADWKMWAMIVTGELGDELDRYGIEAPTQPSVLAFPREPSVDSVD